MLKHGIKTSGMPAWGQTHDDEELWAVTAFVERLPKLDPQQYKHVVASAPADADMPMMPMPGRGDVVHERHLPNGVKDAPMAVPH